MEIEKLIRWLMKMKVMGAKNVNISDINLECYNLEKEKIGSKNFK